MMIVNQETNRFICLPLAMLELKVKWYSLLYGFVEHIVPGTTTAVRHAQRRSFDDVPCR